MGDLTNYLFEIYVPAFRKVVFLDKGFLIGFSKDLWAYNATKIPIKTEKVL